MGVISEHALLIVKKIMSAMNKMDNTEPKFSEARYKWIKSGVSIYLKKGGNEPHVILFVLVSG